MHTMRDNIEIMKGSEIDEIIKELFESLWQRYQEGLEESMKGSEFIFDSVNVLYYNLNTIRLDRGGWNIDSPKWLWNEKTTMDPTNNDVKYFQYSIAVVLNHEQIKSHP